MVIWPVNRPTDCQVGGQQGGGVGYGRGSLRKGEREKKKLRTQRCSISKRKNCRHRPAADTAPWEDILHLVQEKKKISAKKY